MGKPPLDTVEGINCLRNWLKLCGVFTLVDISIWDDNGGWIDWSLTPMPEEVEKQKIQFLNALTDLAPVHLQEEDRWGWGKTGTYTAAQGFYSQQKKHESGLSADLWKHVWDQGNLPKVNFFWGF